MSEHGASHKNDRTMFAALIFAALVITAIYFWPKGSEQLSARAQFAECLSGKGVTMYGTDTCPNCQIQKGMFEQDFERINYINCFIHQDQCNEKGIQGYPTWMYNGQSLMGVQPFKVLAALSSCESPQ